jgi:hypothetical protein
MRLWHSAAKLREQVVHRLPSWTIRRFLRCIELFGHVRSGQIFHRRKQELLVLPFGLHTNIYRAGVVCFMRTWRTRERRPINLLQLRRWHLRRKSCGALSIQCATIILSSLAFAGVFWFKLNARLLCTYNIICQTQTFHLLANDLLQICVDCDAGRYAPTAQVDECLACDAGSATGLNIAAISCTKVTNTKTKKHT